MPAGALTTDAWAEARRLLRKLELRTRHLVPVQAAAALRSVRR